jgi:hypothetical protein
VQPEPRVNHVIDLHSRLVPNVIRECNAFRLLRVSRKHSRTDESWPMTRFHVGDRGPRNGQITADKALLSSVYSERIGF